MKGAIIFLVVFAIFLFATLAETSIPPGNIIYKAVFPNTEQYTTTYVIAGTNAFALIVAVFNGVIFGFIAWLIFTLVNMGRKKDKQKVNVNVTVNNSPNPPPSQN